MSTNYDVEWANKIADELDAENQYLKAEVKSLKSQVEGLQIENKRLIDKDDNLQAALDESYRDYSTLSDEFEYDIVIPGTFTLSTISTDKIEKALQILNKELTTRQCQL